MKQLQEREKSFRLWDKQQKRMYFLGDEYSDCIRISQYGDGSTPAEIGEGDYDNVINGGRLDSSSSPCFMQQTGMQDAGWREIYEHDILTNLDEQINPKLFLVQWNEDLCGFELSGINTSQTLGMSAAGKMNVIGNAFEDPNLLDDSSLVG